MRISTLTAIASFILSSAVRADEPVNAEFFEKQVRPILVAHCVSCHGPKKEKGELRLDAKAGFTKGGQNGPLVKPGDPNESRLIQVIRYDGDIKMPQKGKLADADIAILTAWVKGGAPCRVSHYVPIQPSGRHRNLRGLHALGSVSPTRRLPASF